MAANVRHHPERSDGDRQMVAMASRERKLRDVLGEPPAGTTWLDRIRQIASEAPPLTENQRNTLRLLLGPGSRAAAASSAGRP